MQDPTRSELIRRVVAHFGGLPRCSAKVQEWGEGEEPLIVYWSRWTMAERRQMAAKMSDLDRHGSLVDVVIFKSEDAAGKKLFTLEDKPELLGHASASVVERLALLISSDAELKVADAEKK